MNIDYNILFFPDIEKGKPDGKIRLRIRWGKNVLNFNIGHRIPLNKWSKDTQRCKRNITNLKQVPASVINSEIQHLQDKIDDIFKSYELKGTMPTKEELKKAFNKARGITKKVLIKDFFFHYDQFTSEMGVLNNWTKATYTKLNTVKSHLKSFNPALKFSDLDLNGLTKLVYFLREDKDYRDSTIKKYIGFLKWFLKWSVKKEINQNTEFESFNPKLRKSNSTIVYLYWDELMMLYNYKFTAKELHLERVRDIFCFSCFTSLRYSDVANLKKSDIHKNFISITTVKTADSLKIDLNDYSKEILKKYKNYQSESNYALPVISNQKMNSHLKDLAKLLALDRKITNTYYIGNKRVDEVLLLHDVISTHAGRRTFISNALIMGIPPQTVMQWTGHSDYSAMKPYIAIADKDRAKAMEMFNRK
jgi:integrase